MKNMLTECMPYDLGSNMNIRASQMALVIKSPPSRAGDIRDVGSILGWG